MTSVRTSLLATILLAVLLSACQNDPDPTGIGLIPEDDVVGARRFDSSEQPTDMHNSVFSTAIPTDDATVLSIGEADGYAASALVRWYTLDDTLGEGGRILSATIRLHSAPGHRGDSTQPMTVQLREIKSFWSSFTVTADSLEPRTSAVEVATEVSGSVTQVIGGADSIDIPVDTTLARHWLKLMYDGEYTSNYGVLIEAPGGGLRGFLSSENGSGPELTVLVETDGRIDTLRGGTVEDCYVVRGPDVENGPDLSLRSGLVHRGRLMIDVSGIPGASIVNYASLYLHIDRSRSSAFFSGADSVLVYRSYDSTTLEPVGTALLTRVDENDKDMLIAEGVTLTQAVQAWVNGKGNHGLMLVAWNEASELERLTLHGAEADSTLRPRLVVTYTSKP